MADSYIDSNTGESRRSAASICAEGAQFADVDELL
jgi:hypothetical protein